ncbi:MAG: hypothetical protein ACFB9M_20820 [Myxococcota bacterium]
MSMEARSEESSWPAPAGADWSKADLLNERGVADPGKVSAVAGRLRRDQRFEALAKALSFSAEHAPTPEIGRQAWFEAGRVWQEDLGSPRRAEPFFSRVLATDPNHLPSIESLRDICVRAGRWEEALELCERIAAAHSGSAKAVALKTVAELAEEQLHQDDRALRSLRAAHEADPHNDDVLQHAFELLLRQHRWVECRAVLEERSRFSSVASDFKRLGVQLVQHALFHGLARECLERARTLGDGEALSYLDALADAERSWEERARELVAEGLDTRDKSQAAELYVQAAELYVAYGQNLLKADELLNRAILLRGFGPVIRYLEWVFLPQNRRDELLRRLNGLLASVKDSATKADVALRVARLMAADESSDPDQLAAAFRRVCTLDPKNREAAHAVVRIFRETQRVPEAAQALENFLAAVSDEFTKISVHLQLGRIYAEVLGDSEKAQAHFEAVLAHRPSHVQAATALRALYTDGREQPLLLGVLKVLLEYMPDVSSRVELLSEMERVADQVGPDESFSVARRRFDVLPADETARERFVLLGTELGRHHAVASGLEEAAVRLSSPSLFKAAAEVYQNRLPRPEDAVRCYRQSLIHDPQDAEARAALESLLRQRDDPRAVIELIESQLARAETTDEKKQLLSKLGEIYRTDLGEDRASAQQYEQILELAPEDTGALVALEELAVRLGDAERLERVLSRRERLADSLDVEHDIMVRRAALLADTLGRPEEAAELYIEALARQPERAETVAALQSLLVKEVASSKIAGSLERVFAHQGEYAKQVDMLSVLIQHEPSAQVRRSLALRAAHLCDSRLNALGSAYDYLAIALDLDPTDEAVKDHLLETVERIGGHDRAATLFQRLLRRDLPLAVRASLATALGDLLEGPLGQTAEATEWYKQALEADPASSPAIAALERLLGAQQRHDELAKLLIARLRQTDDRETKVRLTFALGCILADALQAPDQAAERFRQVIGLDPEHRPALSRLATLLESEGRNRELVSTLDRWRGVVQPAREKAELLAWSADALAAAGEPEEAVRRYRQALELVAKLPRALAGLERLMRSGSGNHLKALAGRMLVPHYLEEAQYRGVLEAYEVQLGDCREGPERRDLLNRMAHLSRHELADTGHAFDMRVRALREGLLDSAGMEEMAQWGLEAHRAQDLAETLAQHIADHPQDVQALRLYGRLCDGEALDPSGAHRAWEALLHLEPTDAEALEALERLMSAGGDPLRLAEVLAARADAAPDESRVDYLRRAAALWEEVSDDPSRAIEWLEQALALDPLDSHILEELARLYEKEGQTEARRDLLRRLVDLRTSPVAVADAQVALGHSCFELGQLSEAAEAYASALRGVPDHGAAREGLEALLDSSLRIRAAEILEPIYRRAGDWGRLVRVHEVLASAASDSSEALERAVAIRSLYAERLGAPVQAYEAGKKAYVLSAGDPEHGRAWMRVAAAANQQQLMLQDLRALATQGTVSELSIRALVAQASDAWDRPIEERLHAWRELVHQHESREHLDAFIEVVAQGGSPHELAQLLQRRSEIEPDRVGQARFERRRGEVLMRIRDPRGAAEAFQTSLTADPSQLDLYAKLEGLHLEGGQFEAAAKLLEQWAHAAPEMANDLRLRAARLWADRLSERSTAVSMVRDVLESASDPSEAVETLETWLDAWDDDRVHAVAVAETLERHYESASEPARLADVLRAQVELAGDPQTRTKMGIRLAETYGQALGRSDLAFSAAVRSFAELPTDSEAFESAERWFTDERKDEYASLLARIVDSVEPELQLRFARRGLELLGTESDDDRTMRLLSVVHRLDPDDQQTSKALERHRRRTGDARGLVALYREQIERSESEREQAELWDKVAKVAEVEIRDESLALEAYQRRAQLPEWGFDSRSRFAALCERTERWDLLEQGLQDHAETETDPDKKSRLWLRVAQVRRDRREDCFGAIDAYAEVLAVRPRDPGGMSGLGDLMRSGPVEVRRRAAEVLLPHLEDADAWEDVVQALILKAEAANDLEDRKKSFIQAAAVADERLGRPSTSLEFVLHALRADPDDPPLMAQAEALADLAGKSDDLAGFYADVPEERWGTAAATQAHRWLAAYYEERDDRTRAVGAHELVLRHQPDDPRSLAAMERLLEGGDFSALVEVFLRRIAGASGNEEQVSLLRQLADLQALRAGDSAGAVVTLQRLLEVAPGDEGALGRLDRLLEELNRHAERREVLEQWVESATHDVQRTAEVRLRWAAVEARELGNLSGADRLVQLNLLALPTHERTRTFVEELWREAEERQDLARARRLADVLADACRSAADWSGLSELLPRMANLQGEAPKRSRIWRELGQVYEDRLEQPELAFAAYARAVAQLPSDTEATEALKRTAEAGGLWEDYVDVLGEVLSTRPDPEVHVRFLRERSQVLDTLLDRSSEAIESYQALLEKVPDDDDALEALERRFDGEERWAALVEVLERRAEISEDPERWLRAAQLWADRLQEPDEALRTAQKAKELAVSPETRQAVTVLLARLLPPSPELLEVLRELETESRPGRPRQTVRLRLAQLAESSEVDQPEEAIAAYQRVLADEPGHEGAQEALSELFEQQGKWVELVDVLQSRMARARNDREAGELQRKIALVRGTRLGETEDAVRAWEDVLRRNPNDLEALAALRELHRAKEDWGPMVKVLRSMIPLHARAEESKPIRFELADIFAERLNQKQEAAEVGRRILDIEPHTHAELIRLEKLFRDARAFAEAVRVLHRRAELTETAGDRADVLMEVARIYEQDIGRTAGAVSAYEAVLDFDSRHVDAFDALCRLCEQTGDYRRLVELVGRRLETISDPDLRRDMHLKVAGIQERWLGSKDLAFSAACAAFMEGGQDQDAQQWMERLAAETDNWDVVADLLEEQMEQVSLARAFELRLRAAEVCIDHLQEPERAERHLELAMSMQPGQKDAAKLLADLLTAQERWADVVSLLRDQVEFTPSVEERVDILKVVARMTEERLLDIEPAIRAWQMVSDLSPGDEEAAAELERIYRTDGRPQALFEALERRLERLDPGEATQRERLAIRMNMARVLEMDLGRSGEAVELYRDVLAEHGAHRPALDALESILIQEERWSELLETYEEAAHQATDDEARVSLLTRLAGVHEERLRDPEAALRCLGQALAIDGAHRPSLRTVERLARGRGDWLRAAEALEALLEGSEPEEEAELLERLGGIYLDHLHRPDDAERILDRSLELNPRATETMLALERLYEQRGDWGSVIQILRRRAESETPGLPAAVEVHHRLGRVLVDKAFDREGARAAFARALEMDEGHVSSLDAMDALSPPGSREGLAWAQKAAHRTADPLKRAERHYSVAQRALDDLDDVDLAVENLEEALTADPEHLSARSDVSDLLFSDEQWERAELHLLRLVERLDPVAQREELGKHHYRLAYIAERSEDLDRTLRHYLRSYEYDPGYLPTLEGLGSALVDAERHEEAQGIFQTILVQHRSSLTDAEVVDLHHQVALLSVRLEQPEKATKSVQKALAIDPHHGPSLRTGADLFSQVGRYEDAYELRQRLIPILDEEERFEALLVQGTLCRDLMNEPFRAIDALNQARAMRPDDLQVLEGLVPLLESTRQAHQAVATLERLAELSAEPATKVKFLLQAADLVWREERDHQRSAALYDQALDLEPTNRSALERLEGMLYEARQWTSLEEAYLRMIQRLPKDGKKARAALWRTLAGLYQEVLSAHDKALKALEVVCKLEPQDIQSGVRLAQMLRRDPARRQEAILLCQRILPMLDDPTDSARMLYELNYEAGQYDPAFCGLGALVLRRAATEDEVRAYRHLMDKAPAWPQSALSDAQWRTMVLHPWCRGPIGQVASILYHHAPELVAARRNDMGLRKKEKVDLSARGKHARAGLHFFEVWSRVAMALGARDVEHYHRPGSVQAPVLLPGRPTVLFVGEKHEVFGTLPPRHLAWVIGRQMSCVRPELALVQALAPGDFIALIEAAVRLIVPQGSGVKHPVDDRVITAWTRALQAEASERMRTALAGPVKTGLQQGVFENITAYLEGAEHSASRAALLVSGDWVVAARGLGDPDALFEVPYARRVHQLMLFSLGTELPTLREGLSLQARV